MLVVLVYKCSMDLIPESCSGIFLNKMKYLTVIRGFNVNYFWVSEKIDFFIQSNVLLFTFHSYSVKDRVFFNKFFRQFLIFKNVIYTTRVQNKQLILRGIGLKMSLLNNCLLLKLGFSHLVSIKFDRTVSASLKNNVLRIASWDSVVLGNFVNKVYSTKIADSYKGRGFIFPYQKKVLKLIKKK
jgi:ribosomal protein L6P/L9E